MAHCTYRTVEYSGVGMIVLSQVFQRNSEEKSLARECVPLGPVKIVTTDTVAKDSRKMLLRMMKYTWDNLLMVEVLT